MIESELGRILQIMEQEFSVKGKREAFSKAFFKISSRYREGEESGRFLQEEEDRLAYLFTRLPGTFSAICRVLQESKERAPLFSPTSLLDVGAGPGTGMWAALHVLDTLTSCTLLEKDTAFMSIGKQLVKNSSFSFAKEASWKCCDLELLEKVEPHDLVLLSYSIGEIPEGRWQTLLPVLWKATKQAICIIEPGTPRGYSRLMKIREILLGLGGHLWAPCPHALRCPLIQGDWCHFSVRVPRSSLHRNLKGAALSYEDEKYSYLLFGKEPAQPVTGRILRHPQKRSGHVEFVVCQKEGIQKKITSKKEGDLYKQQKKLEWGDSWP